MRRIALTFASLALVALSSAPAVAAPPGASGKSTVGQLYRYRNSQGVLVIENTIPPEYARKGYQVITRSGQLLEDVPPSEAVDPGEVQRQQDQQKQQMRRDADLRRLYSSPADAERLRDRQLDALTLKVEFARGQLLQLTNKRKLELEQAAKMERQGAAVPKPTRENIERLNRQVAEQEVQIKTLEADKERMRAEFEPVIERLRVLYPARAGSTPAAAAPAQPAAPVAPAPATR